MRALLNPIVSEKLPQKETLGIEIAGVHFSITCPYPVTFDTLSPTYRTFMENMHPARCDVEVRVVLESDNMPDISTMKKIFDTEQSWSLFGQKDEYFLGLNSPALGNQFIWLAHFASMPATITIYCGQPFVTRENGKTTVASPLSYPLDQLLLMYILAKRDGVLIHAAGMHLHGKGFLFPGRSGAGKSTLSRLFLGRDDVGMLSDDRVVVRKIRGIFDMFGTPWAGDAGIAENATCPLSGIFFIRHANEDIIREIKPREAVERLVPVTSIPWYDRKVLPEVLACCEEIVSSVPAYELSFRPDSEAVNVFKKFISG